MNCDLEKFQILNLAIKNGIKFKSNEIQINKVICREGTEESYFKIREKFIITYIDANNKIDKFSYIKDWFIGDEGAEIIDRCLMLMNCGELSSFQISNNENPKIFQFSIEIHSTKNSQSLIHCDDSYVIKMSDHYKVRGNEFFKTDSIEKALENYSYSLKLVWIYHSFKYGIYGHQESNDQDNKPISDCITNLLLNISACQLKVDSFNFVIENCSTIIQAYPQCVKALYRRGKALFHIGKLDEAFLDLKMAHELNPSNTEILKDYNEVRGSLGKYSDYMADKMKKMFS